MHFIPNTLLHYWVNKVLINTYHNTSQFTYNTLLYNQIFRTQAATTGQCKKGQLYINVVNTDWMCDWKGKTTATQQPESMPPQETERRDSKQGRKNMERRDTWRAESMVFELGIKRHQTPLHVACILLSVSTSVINKITLTTVRKSSFSCEKFSRKWYLLVVISTVLYIAKSQL